MKTELTDTRFTVRPVTERRIVLDENGDWEAGPETELVAVNPGDEGYEAAPYGQIRTTISGFTLRP
jgi:hypothetical protein